MQRLTLLLVASAACFALAAPAGADKPGGKEVEVVNGPDNPVPVFDVDAARGEPFHKRTQIDVSLPINETLFAVPADRRAVIETVSAVMTLPPAPPLGALLGVETTLDGVKAEHYLVLSSQGEVLTSEVRTANHDVRLYAGPGTVIRLIGAAPATASLFVTLSGQLFDAPPP